jgi:PAS domain S-box-containing protein
MMVDNATNNMILDILKNILSMDDRPIELGEYTTTQIQKIVDSELVALIIHNENIPTQKHDLLGIAPKSKKEILDSDLIERIAEASHFIHSPQLVCHDGNGTQLEQLLSAVNGKLSIVVPLEYRKNRIGLMLLLNISENIDIQSINESLDALSGVLALEFLNANLVKNLEFNVDARTREVLENEKRFRSIIELATDAMFLFDLHGNLLDTNQQACLSLGYTREELLKLKLNEIDTLIDSKEKINEYFQFYQPNQKNIFESFHRKKDGTIFPVEVSNNVIELEGKNYIVGFVSDISNLKVAEEKINTLNEELEQKEIERTNELENKTRELIDNQKALLNLVEDINEKSEELIKKTEQLQLSNKELETFSYSVSHDLRAPLRAINGFIKILVDDYNDKFDDEGKRICNIIETNAVKMGKLIDDLLSFSRLGRSEIHRKNIDMQDLVKQTIAELNPSGKNKNINIKTDNLPKAICDSNLIRQVWINLISNAIKYASLNEETQIHIGAKSDERETIYFIEDNGIGFDMNYLHKLFGVFQRLHNRKEFEGTGVGLAIVQQIIQKHGGRVWAEGTIDKGAIFYFSLPKQFNHLN